MRRILALAALVVLLIPQPAEAHGAGQFPKFQGPANPSFFYFRDSFPNDDSGRRFNVIAGFAAWNVRPGSTLHWYQGGFDFPWYASSSNPCLLPEDWNGVWWIDTSHMGKVYSCTWPDGRLYAVTMYLDSVGPNWHFGQDVPDEDEYDFQYITTHEAGHASGGIHFLDSEKHCWWPEPSGYRYETMCRQAVPGRTLGRSPEGAHELVALAARY